MTFGSPRNGLKKKKRKMLSPARNAQREEEIQEYICMNMYDEIDDFFESLGDDVTRDQFDILIKGHNVHTFILMKNIEDIEEEIDHLWVMYQESQEEEKALLIRALMNHHENLDPLGKIGFYMRFNDEDVISSMIYDYIFHQ